MSKWSAANAQAVEEAKMAAREIVSLRQAGIPSAYAYGEAVAWSSPPGSGSAISTSS
jgi:hypothetical protein